MTSMGKCSWLSLTLVFLFCMAFVAYSQEKECEYLVGVRTGTMDGAGTDAVVNLGLYDKTGDRRYVTNLEMYGVYPRVPALGEAYEHQYFENSQEDRFIITTRCLTYEVCKVELSHDNSGNRPDWYVQYVTVRVRDAPKPPTGITFPIRYPKYSKVRRFDVDRWLSVNHNNPPSLTAIVDECNST